MAIASVSSGENLFISSTEEKAKAVAAENKGKVSQDQFLILLTTQLTNQDPLNPVDDTEFVSQMAQLQALDEQLKMTKELSAMRVETQLQTGSSLIGKDILGVDRNGNDASGIVNRVIVRDGETFLELDNKQRVPIKSVQDVAEPLVVVTP